jgi:hypothetical protein
VKAPTPRRAQASTRSQAMPLPATGLDRSLQPVLGRRGSWRRWPEAGHRGLGRCSEVSPEPEPTRAVCAEEVQQACSRNRAGETLPPLLRKVTPSSPDRDAGSVLVSTSPRNQVGGPASLSAALIPALLPLGPAPVRDSDLQPGPCSLPRSALPGPPLSIRPQEPRRKWLDLSRRPHIGCRFRPGCPPRRTLSPLPPGRCR